MNIINKFYLLVYEYKLIKFMDDCVGCFKDFEVKDGHALKRLTKVV